MGIWEHLGGYFIHGQAEWVETRDMTQGDFDSRLRISYGPLKFSHMFIMHLQCFLRDGQGHACTST